MDSLIGIVGKDFVILASDTGMSSRGVVMVQSNQDKMYKLSDRLAMLISGEPGDVEHFAEFIKCNLALYKMMHEELDPKAATGFIRRQIYQSLRSKEGSSLVNMIVAGFDKHQQKAQLFLLDYLGGMNESPFAFEGFCQYFGLAMGDRTWKPDMDETQVMSMLNSVINEISHRMAFSSRCFFVRKIDAHGIHMLDNIYPPQAVIERPSDFSINKPQLEFKRIDEGEVTMT